ncbi:MAG TPA: hypothetical protein VET48_05405 [Steroidobacteraceae bacterium]|nr:hypothetical protein [Steroidobacteraceae bacterium]
MPFLRVTLACGLIAFAGHTALAAESKSELRGMTWDSIKKMPDFGRGMWTPGRPPGAAASAARPPGEQPARAGFGADVPFTPKYRAKADARMLRVRGLGPGGENDIPLSNSGFCIPSGVPEVMMQVSHEYVFKPGVVIMLLENSEIRRIWIDGRGHPSDDESNPSFEGHSIGHWEGDTLVVETTQIYPEAELFFGMTVTEKTVMKERIRLADKDTLRIDTVVEDDELFTKPWTFTRYYHREDREAVPYERCTLADRAKKVGDKLIGIDFNVNREKPGENK